MGKKVEELEEKLAKIVPLLESIAKGSVQTRSHVAELMENQTAMMEQQMALMAEMKGMREDVNKLKHAILYVFEVAASASASGKGMTVPEFRTSAKKIRELVDGGLNALANHRGNVAMDYVAKIKSESGSNK